MIDTFAEKTSALNSITKVPDMVAIMQDLFPVCRSITGEGTLMTLHYLKDIIPITIRKLPTGTKVFDWTIPKEWNIRDAYIRNSAGQKIVDFKKSNLHIVNYSIPIHQSMSLDKLSKHIHTLPEHPDWIPYRTTYYQERWGFCMTHNQFKALPEDEYEVYIDATLEPGHLHYGELIIKGKTPDEILITTHICHPSLCNDNLSGIAVVTHLARRLLKRKHHRYTYRILFIPGTIGAIAWLAINELKLGNIKHGLVAALLGGNGTFTYKKSRRGDAEIDKVAEYILKVDDSRNTIRAFTPYGYDERQFCSPAFNLPVGNLTRTPYGEYPEYHTSADNLDLVSAEALEGSLQIYQKIIDMLEANGTFVNTNPKGEPQLGKYGLYDQTGGANDEKEFQMALLWVLNQSDGHHALLDIASRSALKFDVIRDAAEKLEQAGLLKEV